MWRDDEAPERLGMSVTHIKGPSVLEYDEMNIHVKGWVIMKSKCAKVNEYCDNLIRS